MKCIVVSARDIGQLERLAWIAKDNFIGKFVHASQIGELRFNKPMVIRSEPKHSAKNLTNSGTRFVMLRCEPGRTGD
jgi:hypothetical protein